MKKNRGNYPFLILVFAALLSAFLLNTFVFASSRVSGRSMQPLLEENDWILTGRLAYSFSDPAPGDVILFWKKDVTAQPVVKRIVGAPLDTVEVLKDGILEEITVPAGCYYVMGDNREESHDSRVWDDPFVKREDIIGKVLLKYFPGFAIVK